MQRRDFLKYAAIPALTGIHSANAQVNANVVVIGGGFAGATVAKYLRDYLPIVKITLIEPNSEFISCPMSNRVLHGGMAMRDLTRPYERFAQRHSFVWMRSQADAIDPDKKLVHAGGQKIPYDRLIVAPGIDFIYENIEGMQSVDAQRQIMHAWKAGEQTLQLRRQISAMRNGGTIAMHIPKVPYRCPPGPYERASLLAYYLANSKPNSKLLVFDANEDIQSKKDLFKKAWAHRYKNIIEYVPNAEIKSVDAAGSKVQFEMHGAVKADVWNIIPPQRAGRIARNAGLATVQDRWCGVDLLSYESLKHKHIHVIGDAIAASPGMPKSAHMANQQAKVCAAAVAASLTGQKPSENPIIANTCYSFVSQTEVIHVAAVYRYDKATKHMKAVVGAGGMSEEASVVESIYAMSWLNNILNDTIG